jgi:cell division protein FtsA
MKDKSLVENNGSAENVKRTKIVVGLDIGTTKIACFVGKKNDHGKIEILSMGKSESLGVMSGVVSNIKQTVESIILAVQETQGRVEGNLIIKNINVGIAGQHIKSLQHRGIYTRNNSENEIAQEDINALVKDMHKLVMNPGEEIIDVIPQEYIVDNQHGIKNPIGMAGVRLEANFHIITGHVSNVQNIRRCVENAGLQIKHFVLEPIASADAVLTQEEKDEGVVLVDIGGGTTDVAIFYEGIIRHTAVIPFGGNVITEDIKEGCKIIRRHAENLKVRFGSAFASESNEHEVVCIPGFRGKDPKEITLRNLAKIIQSRMEDIIELVHYEIENSGFSKKILAGIVVTGGGAQMKHLTQLFEYTTGIDTRIGYPNEHLANPTQLDNLASPMYSTGIGLVLKGFEKMENLPDDVSEAPTNNNKTVSHNDPKLRGNFFNKILNKLPRFLEDD